MRTTAIVGRQKLSLLDTRINVSLNFELLICITQSNVNFAQTLVIMSRNILTFAIQE